MKLKTIIMIAIVGSCIPNKGYGQMVTDTLSFKDYVFAGLSPSLLQAAYFFAGLGLLFRWAVRIRKGVKSTSNESPAKFSIGYWFANNAKHKLVSIILTVISLFVTFRFTGEIYNMALSMFVAFTAGVSIDWIIEKIAKLTVKK
jgi:hypothetical protein